MLHADQDGEKVQALLRLLTELMERVRVVEALSNVPQMYCLAVVEVVRRKMFTRHYREVRETSRSRDLPSRLTSAHFSGVSRGCCERSAMFFSFSVGVLAGEGREVALRCREAEEGVVWKTLQ